MKDYKLSDIKKICKDNNCETCPIGDFCWDELTHKPDDWKFKIDEKDGEEE